MSVKEQREEREGKPFFGILFGRSVILGYEPSVTDIEEISQKLLGPCPEGLERRNTTVIYRPAYHAGGPLILSATLGCKFIMWGRAYKVMRLLRKGKKRHRKMYINGMRKKREISRS
jgi:hypothetical protein